MNQRCRTLGLASLLMLLASGGVAVEPADGSARTLLAQLDVYL